MYEKIIREAVREENWIGEGLVHSIYSLDNKVFKVPKDNFIEFHSIDHFLIEKGSAELLQVNKQAGRILEVIPPEETGLGRAVLVREYISGRTKSKPELTREEGASIIKLLERGHDITLDGYGPLGPNMKGSLSSWDGYIMKSIVSSMEYILNEGLLEIGFAKELMDFLDAGRVLMRYERSPRFVFNDVNPGNIFFDESGTIRAVIDIDHPCAGDPLYDYACLKWYNPLLFRKQENLIDLTAPELKTVLMYELLQGAAVIAWMDKNFLDTSVEKAKLRKKYNSLSESV